MKSPTLGHRSPTIAALLLACALIASACATDGEPIAEVAAPPTASVEPPQFVPTALPLPTTAPIASSAGPSPVPAATATPLPTPTPQPEGPCNAGPLALPNPDRPRYQASLIADPTAGTVNGTWSVVFTPDLPTDEIVIRLWANGPRPRAGGADLSMTSVTVDAELIEVDYEDPTLAHISLGRTLDAGQSVVVEATLDFVMTSQINSRISRREDYMRLGTLLPLLPWEPGKGWATDPATALFAEAVSSPVADYSVTITVPDDFDVLASGVRNADGIWKVEAARDFSISIGRFRTVEAVAMAPNPVQVTVGVHETLGDDADTYLAYIVAALESFSSRWGQYPWPSLTIALTPGLSGGIEFPTHIMQGPDTFGRTTSHEVGHMFFYSLVGNNQGTEPWLDEGLTSYAEFTFEGTPPNAYGIPAAGVGNATQPMTFWETRSDIYYRSVYGQTGFALQQLGPQADVDCALARYVAANAHRIATADEFIAAFEPTFPNVRDQLAALGVVTE